MGDREWAGRGRPGDGSPLTREPRPAVPVPHPGFTDKRKLSDNRKDLILSDDEQVGVALLCRLCSGPAPNENR